MDKQEEKSSNESETCSSQTRLLREKFLDCQFIWFGANDLTRIRKCSALGDCFGDIHMQAFCLSMGRTKLFSKEKAGCLFGFISNKEIS
jgi:hypothetical protein